MLKYVMIGIGGVTGAIARYLVGNYIGSRYGVRFPYGTFVINLSGSFLVGLTMTLFSRTAVNPNWRYLIPIGFIGAYTTFSTFEYETLQALQAGQVVVAALNVGLSVVLGFLAVWAGTVLGRVAA